MALPHSPARPLGWALGWVWGSLSSRPRANNAFCVPLSWSPGAVAGPLPNLGPPSGQGQSAGHYAKAAQEGSMGSKVGTDRAPQTPHLLAMTPKEQN